MYATADTTGDGAAHVTVRLAVSSDTSRLARLAALDSADAPEGTMLVAEVEGKTVAALPVSGGRAIADPFRRTAAVVALLELRAAQLRGEADDAARRAHGSRLRGLVRVPRALSTR